MVIVTCALVGYILLTGSVSPAARAKNGSFGTGDSSYPISLVPSPVKPGILDLYRADQEQEFPGQIVNNMVVFFRGRAEGCLHLCSYSSEIQANPVEIESRDGEVVYRYTFSHPESAGVPVNAEVEMRARTENDRLILKPSLHRANGFDMTQVGLGLSFGLKHGTMATMTPSTVYYPKKLAPPKSYREHQLGTFSVRPFVNRARLVSIYDGMPDIGLETTQFHAYLEYETRNVTWERGHDPLHARWQHVTGKPEWIELVVLWGFLKPERDSNLHFTVTLHDADGQPRSISVK